MACPFFEPAQAACAPQHPGARLPLIREFEGFCHASGEPVAAPPDMQFRFCNHGYSRSECIHFAPHETVSCLRYTAIAETPDELEILCIDETDHTPVAWQSLRYPIATGVVEADVNICRRAQIAAFARSYLECLSTKR